MSPLPTPRSTSSWRPRAMRRRSAACQPHPPGAYRLPSQAPCRPPADHGAATLRQRRLSGSKLGHVTPRRGQGRASRPLSRLPDGRGRDAQRTVRENPAADRRTATTISSGIGPKGPKASSSRASASEWRAEQPNRSIRRRCARGTRPERRENGAGRPWLLPHPGRMLGSTSFPGVL